MTSLPHVPYANTTTPLMSYLDDTFAAVGALTIIPCTANGANSITLTPVANTPAVGSYTTGAPIFQFNPNGDSTTAVTVQVNALGLLPLYLSDGVTQAGNGTLVAGQPVMIAYIAFLNSGAGGFILLSGAGSALSPATTPGVVSMRHTSGTWAVYNPDGSVVSIANSSTQGLQEAINAACTTSSVLGYDLEVLGGDAIGGAPIYINCSKGITFPPAQGKKIRFGSVNIQFDTTVTGPGITFDSQEIIDIDLSPTQIIYTAGGGSGPAILFQPKNGTPLDKAISITSGRIRIGVLAMAITSGGPSHAVQFDTTYGGIGSVEIEFGEINGAGNSNTSPATAVGIFVNDPPPSASFETVKLRVTQLHEMNSIAVQLGTTSASNSRIRGNIFEFVSLQTAGPNATTGIDCWGSNNIITVGEIEYGGSGGSLANYCVFEPGANSNWVEFGSVLSGSFSDSGTGNRLIAGGTQVNNRAQGTTGHDVALSGKIENWGQVVVGANSSAPVAFGMAFPTAFMGATVSVVAGVETSLPAPSWDGASTTGLVVHNNNGVSQTLAWLAWGY